MNSFIGWIGGKNYLKKAICERMSENFERYIEVFGGAAWVLFYKDKHANMEIYNDYNSELINLFRCVKYHCPEIQRELSLLLNSRELFEDFTSQYSTRGFTDIQKAARFFFILKTSYGSKGKSYGCIKKNINVMTEYLARIQDRLHGVIIENKDFEDLIRIYDRPNAFFYLDPPYYKSEKYYQVEFLLKDHKRLLEVLKKIKGRFILSYNNCEDIKDYYKDFKIEEIKRVHNLRVRYKKEEKFYYELIIRNY